MKQDFFASLSLPEYSQNVILWELKGTPGNSMGRKLEGASSKNLHSNTEVDRIILHIAFLQPKEPFAS